MMVYREDPTHPSMSSEILRKRGTCCKSNCLHCPYGYTIKTYGLEFLAINEKTQQLYEELVSQLKMVIDLERFNLDDYKMITLKGFIFGLIRVDHLFVREMEILPSFQKQGISKELVESYYFY